MPESGAAHGGAERIIVRQLIGDRFQPADLGERLSANGDGRAEAGRGKAQHQADQRRLGRK